MISAAATWEGMSEGLTQELAEAMRRGYVAAYRWLGHPEQARDACQEAALRALRAEHRYDRTQPFYPWFYRILKNHCLDRLRQRKKGTVELSTEPRDPAQPGAEALALSDERSAAVQRAITELPDELRAVIELRHFQDASYEEMAAILAIPAGTVMSRLYRARKQLRAKLTRDPAIFDRAAAGVRTTGSARGAGTTSSAGDARATGSAGGAGTPGTGGTP